MREWLVSMMKGHWGAVRSDILDYEDFMVECATMGI